MMEFLAPLDVRTVGDEYRWLQMNLGSFTRSMQSLVEVDGRKYDVLDIVLADGRPARVWFDVTDMLKAQITRLRGQLGEPAQPDPEPRASEWGKVMVIGVVLSAMTLVGMAAYGTRSS